MANQKINVQYVARLARLKLTEGEISKFNDQLGTILSYIDKLNTLDTDTINPTSHVLPLKNVYRDDTGKASLDDATALSNAPESRKKFFKVPKIIDEA